MAHLLHLGGYEQLLSHFEHHRFLDLDRSTLYPDVGALQTVLVHQHVLSVLFNHFAVLTTYVLLHQFYYIVVLSAD